MFALQPVIVSFITLTTNGIFVSSKSALNVVDVISVSSKAETLKPDDRIVFLQHLE